MKKSSIGGKQYLAYLRELGEIPIYIIGGLAYYVSLRYHGLTMVQNSGDLHTLAPTSKMREIS